MFFALVGFQSPVLRSKSPGAQSVTMPLPIGVLLRRDVPPHWFQSPGLMTGLCPEETPLAVLSMTGFAATKVSSAAGLAADVFCSSAGFSSLGAADLSASTGSAGF